MKASVNTRARVISSPKVAKLAAPVVKPEASPAWLQSTPNPVSGYFLSMISDSSSIQEIEVTRSEFEELKRALAEMRGFIPKPASAVQAATLQ